MGENIIQFSVRSAIRMQFSVLIMVMPLFMYFMMHYVWGVGHMESNLKLNKTFAHPVNMWYYSFIGFCLIIVDALEPAIWQSQIKKFMPVHCTAFLHDYTAKRMGTNPLLTAWVFMNQYRNGYFVAFNAVNIIMMGHPSTLTTTTTSTTDNLNER